jgi:hypothetical protein
MKYIKTAYNRKFVQKWLTVVQLRFFVNYLGLWGSTMVLQAMPFLHKFPKRCLQFENMNRNFLNIDEKQKDKSIFRVISIKKLFELFENKENVLVKPTLWDDPFENFIMNSTGELEDGQMFSIGFRDHFFGQCWTKTRESDAMWRIYSPDKKAVRIATTPRKLLRSLYDTSDEYRDIHCYIGGVY